MIEIHLEKKLLSPKGELNLKVDFKIKKGDFISIYGTSGAGKTTIIRMISGLLNPDKGSILVNENIWLNTQKNINIKPQNRKVGLVFQDYALFPNMSVKENLVYALEKGQDSSIISELIKVVELEDLQDTKPSKLSGGQKQRVALARALVQKPEILMLDEPLSALDKGMRLKLQNYLLKLHKKFELTIIMISHDLGEVLKMCNRVFVLENGMISKYGNPIDILCESNNTKRNKLKTEIIKIQNKPNYTELSLLIGENILTEKVSLESALKMEIGDVYYIDKFG